MNQQTMSTRASFDAQMAEIRKAVLQMGDTVVDMIRLACDAVCQSDVKLANKVVELDDLVDNLESETVQVAIVTLMRQAPVATDLLELTAVFGILTEIEQAGDDTVKLARRTIKLTGQFPAELKVDMSELGERTRQIFAGALRLFMDFSPDLAAETIAADKEIDQMYKQARNRVISMIQTYPDRARSFVRVIDTFHALEHVADHAVEIAKRLQTHRGQRPQSEATATPA